MRYIKLFECFSIEIINELRVRKEERVQIHKDHNIIVVVPLTHRALRKYANSCQWCINSDLEEWQDYHRGNHAIIIQRNPIKPKIGVTENPVPEEIFTIAKWDRGESSFEDVCQMLNYEFRNEMSLAAYYKQISTIEGLATNIVYYSPTFGVYDMEDNLFSNFNLEIGDVPNVSEETIEIIDTYFSQP